MSEASLWKAAGKEIAKLSGGADGFLGQQTLSDLC